MPDCSVVMLPGVIAPDRATWMTALLRAGHHVLDIDLPLADPAPLATRACAAIHALSPPGPLIVIAPRASCGILAAIGLAQRRAHRTVLGYLLVDPVEDPTSPDWPDAPVTALDTGLDQDLAHRGRLRGWETGSLSAPSDLVAAIVAAGG